MALETPSPDPRPSRVARATPAPLLLGCGPVADSNDHASSGTAWIPKPTERHAEVLGALLTSYQLRGNLVPDADLAALAIEHGLTICSADTDFARFREITWMNPLDR